MKSNVSHLGIIFPAYGADYVQMAAVAAISAREAGNSCPIHLHTNMLCAEKSKVLLSIFDEVVVSDLPDNQCLFEKIEAIRRSPFEKTIVMDADQLVLKKIDHVIDVLLERFEFCVPLRCTPARTRYNLPGLDSQEQFSHWHTGVFAFKKTNTTLEFFDSWRRVHIEEEWKPDQPSFAKAVFLQPSLRLLTLDVSWVWCPKYYVLEKQIRGQIKLDHYVDVNQRPTAARKIIEINSLLKEEAADGFGALLCLSDASERRHRLIASRFYDNPFIPFVRKMYNTLKSLLGIKRRIAFIHKRRAWK